MVNVILTIEDDNYSSEEFLEIINKSIEKTLEVMDLNSNYEVSVTLVDGKTIRELNREYRGVDKVTDVLSFPLDFGSELDMPITPLGDVVINLEKIKEQAEEFGHSEMRELSYLTVHSLLHLLGFDHIADEDRKDMREKEKKIMKALDILK